MANVKILNGDGDAKYIKSSGAGSDVDPHINEVTANLSATDNAVLDAAVTALEIIDNMISGSEAQVDIVAALPAGTNNIGDVDVLSIAAGDNNIGNVDIVTVPAPLNVAGPGTEAAALRVTIATDSTGVLSIDDNGGTITVDGTVAVTNAGITTIAGAVAGTEMQVDVLTMPTVTVNAHAVTNAGTFAVQESGAALTALQLIDNAVSGAGFNITQLGGAAVPIGAGTEAAALRVTLATDSTGVVSIDDNGGALTVDGTVAVTNAGITTIAGAVAGTEMQVDVVAALPAGTNAIGKLAANSGVDIGDVDILSIAAGSNIIGKVQPFAAMIEGGLTELVGINEQVDQNDYSGSVEVALGATMSGEILSFAFYATEDGTGAVQDSAGILYVFDADPSIASGDTSMTAAERVTVLGKVAIGAADWDTDANGGLAYISTVPIPFHALASLFFVWKHLDATALNDAAGDDEQLEFNFWFKRES